MCFPNRFLHFVMLFLIFSVTPAQCLEWEEVRKEVGRGSGASTLCLFETFQTKENVDTVNFIFSKNLFYNSNSVLFI